MASVMETNGEAEQRPTGTSPEQERAVEECRRWFDLDKQGKEFYVEEMDENDKLYTGKHWDVIGPHGGPLRTSEQQKTRPNCVENVVFAIVEGLTAEFANDIDLVFFPIEPTDEPAAVVMTDLTAFIAYKNRIAVERIKWLRNFFKHGTAIWEHVWDPHWRGGKGPNKWEGEVRWRTLSPRHFFPDARCGEDLANARRVHKAKYVTLEHLREHYPTYGHLAVEEVMDTSLLGDEESQYEHTQNMTLLVETWYVGEPLILGPGEANRGFGLHVIWWCGEGQSLYLHHANYAYYEPGEDVTYPFTVRQRYPRDGSIWGYGEAWYLKAPQIALNKTAELILESHMHHALGMTLYQSGALSEEQQRHVKEYGTLPGVWHEVNDLAGIKRDFGNAAAPSLQNEVGRLQRAMENITGRFDVSQGRTPGSVTAFRALDLLAQRAQVRLRSADVAITTAYEDVGQYINHLVCRNYTEDRAYRIIGQDEKSRPAIVKRGMFKLGDMQRVYDYRTGMTMPASQFMPPPGAVEGMDFELYSPELDVQARTSTQMPSDRTFYMEMAKELFTTHLIDPDTFFYVLENGVFPPYEELVQRMSLQGLTPPGGGGSLPPSDTPSVPPGALPPNLAAMASQLPPGFTKQMLSAPGGEQAIRLGNGMPGGGT